MPNIKIIIIGRSGQLAQQLYACKPVNIDLIFAGRNDVDITSFFSINSYLQRHNPAVVINTAAYTAVDNAEVETDNVFLINKSAVANIAEACSQHGSKLIHISTDFIFDGVKSTAYTTDDTPNPISVYGKSKAAGEKVVLEYCNPNFSIVRISWLYSMYGNNFLKTMLNIMSQRDVLSVVDDQISSPTCAVDLCCFLFKLAQLDKFEPIYNWTDCGVASWYDFAVAIYEYSIDAKLLDNKIKIIPIKSSSYPAKAKRPAFSLLDRSGSNEILEGKHWRVNLRSLIYSMVGQKGS